MDADQLRLAVLAEVSSALESTETGKALVRSVHQTQRETRARKTLDSLGPDLDAYLSWFANGTEVSPADISARLVPVVAGSDEAAVFRVATLLWSIPVSQGFGRRLRYLVIDKSNQKVMGLIALGDPVFNLGARDNAIGWTAADRAERLVNVMDAYVLGAVPPYGKLLGGKLVASLLRSKDLRDAFADKYGSAKSIISGRRKNPSLLAITTTSALGRSSVYNRLKLDGDWHLKPLGYTSGYGHFHISDELFGHLRDFLADLEHPYASGNRFGQGPNWRFRVVREAIVKLGLDRSILRHGHERQVFMTELAENSTAVLAGEESQPRWNGLRSVGAISELARERWVWPRACRRPGYADWTREKTKELMLAATGDT